MSHEDLINLAREHYREWGTRIEISLTIGLETKTVVGDKTGIYYYDFNNKLIKFEPI